MPISSELNMDILSGTRTKMNVHKQGVNIKKGKTER